MPTSILILQCTHVMTVETSDECIFILFGPNIATIDCFIILQEFMIHFTFSFKNLIFSVFSLTIHMMFPYSHRHDIVINVGTDNTIRYLVGKKIKLLHRHVLTQLISD